MLKKLFAALMAVAVTGVVSGAEEGITEKTVEAKVADSNWTSWCPGVSISSGGYDKLFTEVPAATQAQKAKMVILRLGLPINDSEERVNGVDLALLASINVVKLNGVQISTLLSWPERFSGLQFSGFANVTTEAEGISIAPIVNAAQQYQGVQFGLMNAAYPDLFTMIGVEPLPSDTNLHSYGVQVGAVGNLAEYSTGLQFSGLCNAAISHEGMQSGLFNQAAAFEGFQLGLVNFTEKLRGIQIGVSNCSQNGGVQIALFNLAEKETLQIGLVNRNPSGFLPLTLFVNF